MEEKVLGSMDGRESYSGKKGKVPGLRNRSRKPGSLPVWVGEEVAEAGARPGGNLQGPGMTCILVITKVRSAGIRHNGSLTQ